MSLFCLHAHELPHRLPDGTLRLRCAACGHEREHLLYGPTPAFHRTQEGGELSGNSGELTGIERELHAVAAESARINAGLQSIERAEVRHRAKLTVMKRYGAKEEHAC